MKIWLPYIETGGGADVYTERLAAILQDIGHETALSKFPSKWQHWPWVLKSAVAPMKVDLIVATSPWSFVFKRQGVAMVAIVQSCFRDPEFRAYRSTLKSAYYESVYRYFENSSLRSADAVIAISDHTAAVIRQLYSGIDPHVIKSGIDTAFFCPPPTGKLPVEGRNFRILYVGNLLRRKGADLLPEILCQLGSGFELRYTTGWRSDFEMPPLKNATDLGLLDARGVLEEYRKCDVLLFPTRLEAFPYPPLEAMACATPVVASECCALPEIVIDGETGALCPVGDVGSFVRTLSDLSHNPGLVGEFGRAARARVEKHFSLKNVTDAYREFLASAAASSSGTR